MEIVISIIKYLVPLVLGYLFNAFKNYKKTDNVQSEALKILLQSSLTDIYFRYADKQEIPEYVYKNWINQLKAYEDLGGDDYIHDLHKKISKFKIIKES